MRNNYQYEKAWRLNNRDKWYSQKKRHNERTLKTATQNQKHYTENEIKLILDTNKTIREIGLLLNRSYYAISQARSRYKGKF